MASSKRKPKMSETTEDRKKKEKYRLSMYSSDGTRIIYTKHRTRHGAELAASRNQALIFHGGTYEISDLPTTALKENKLEEELAIEMQAKNKSQGWIPIAKTAIEFLRKGGRLNEKI